MRSYSRTKIINEGFKPNPSIPREIVNSIMTDYFKAQLKHAFNPEVLIKLYHLSVYPQANKLFKQ